MKKEEIQDNYFQSSEISKFYEGKSIFISGAGGFLGKILLEILLRCCPGIIRIYILLRPKNGLLAEDRKKEIFQKEIFHKLIQKNPDVLNKVSVVAGDVSQDNLGMCENDLNRIIRDVTIVFHCAASVSFLKPISFLMIQNVIGTDNVINLCKKLHKLEVLVYTSTLFSNTNRKKDIKEIVYELPFKAEEVVRMARIGDEDALNAFFSKCNPNFINYYTFSKCVAENLLVEKASDLPVSIMRPSLIIACFKGILPGYADKGSTLSNLSVAIGLGLLRGFRSYGTTRLEFIPADMAANTHVVAAFVQATKKFPSPSVYNCTSGEMFEHTWKDFGMTVFELCLKKPLPDCYIIPSITYYNNPLLYNVHFFLSQSIPSLIIDVLLCLTGQKPRMLKSCKFLNRMMKVAEPFMENQWDFSCENFASLSEQLSEKDAEIFNVDISQFNMHDWTQSIYTGCPYYRVNNKPYEDTFSHCLLRYLITYSIRFAMLGIIATLCYIVFY